MVSFIAAEYEIGHFRKSEGELRLLCHVEIGWDSRSSVTLNEHTGSLASMELH